MNNSPIIMGIPAGRPTRAAGARRARLSKRGLLLCGLVAGMLAMSAPWARAQTYEAQSQLWFDSSGSDQAAFGPSEIITITGNLTHFPNCRALGGGLDDSFIATSADVYVVRHNTSFLKLQDVRGSPSVMQSGLLGEAFLEQELATTQPTGVLASGDYDVVIDECQDGFWDVSRDLRLGGFGSSPAFTVFVPASVDDLSSFIQILNMKNHALLQERAWLQSLRGQEVFFAVADLAYLGTIGITESLVSKVSGFGTLAFLAKVELQTVAASANAVRKYARIAADPPDPVFQQLVTLSPTSPLPATDSDPVLRQAAANANAYQQEGLLQDALLAALEKYQGAQARGDGYWALAHAREIQQCSNLLADQLARTQTAVSAFRGAVASISAAFDQGASHLQAFQARVRVLGFTAAEQKGLLGLGLDSSGMAAAREEVLKQDYSVSSAEFLSQLDALASAEGDSISSYKDLAAAMNNIISSLTAQRSLDRSQPIAAPGGPYTGQVGTPVTFKADGSSDPYGMNLTYAWDLNGDGLFDEATGAVVAFTFKGPFSGHIAVRVTNEAGKEAVGYAYVTVADANRAPIFGTVSPSNASLTAAPGDSLAFQAAATDPDGDVVTIRWLVDGKAAATGAAFTHTPVDADVGLHVVEARVSDNRSVGGVTTRDWAVMVARPVALADLSVTQTDFSDPVLTGSNVTYAVTVKNQGPDTAPGVTLTNVIPAGADFVTATASQGTTLQSGGIVTASFGSLAAGASALVNITVTPTMPGILTNVAMAASSALDLNPADNTVAEHTRANAPSPNVADLSLSQLVYPALGTVGQTLMYTLFVNNLGPNLATGVTLVDTLPPGVKLSGANPVPDSVNGNVLSFSLGDIPPNVAPGVTILVVPTAAGDFVNSAVATANETDPNLTNNTSTLSKFVTAEAAHFTDLAMGQAITPNPVTLSNQLTLTLTVTNLGPDESTGATIVNQLPTGLTFLSATPAPDLLNGGLASFSLASISNGQTATVVIQARPDSIGLLANIATVNAGNVDTNAPNNQSRAEFLVNSLPTAQSDLAISLASSTNQLPIGSNFTITITVTNVGPDRATNTVITASIPTGLSLVTANSSIGAVTTNNASIKASLGTLASGVSATLTFTGTALLGRPLVSVATAASDNNDPNSTNNIGSITVLAMDTSATVAIERNFADGEIDMLQAYLAEMGLASQVFDQEGLTSDQLLSYRLAIWDDLSYGAGGIGPNDVQLLKSAHDAGARLYLIGDDLAYSAIYALVEPERGEWVNLLHLKATTVNGGGDGTMEIINATHPVVNGPFGLVGNSIYYYDPDGTTATGDGEAVLGRSGPDDVLLAYKDPVTKNKTVTQNELVHTQTDANGLVQRKILFQNAVAWLLSDDASADLSVTQSTTPASVSVGGDLIYTVIVANNGPDAATAVTLTDLLPANATFVSAKFSQGAGSITNNILTANLGVLAPNGNATLILHITAGPEEMFTNLVSVLGLEEDSYTNNNLAVSLLAVGPIGSLGSVPKADLRVTQSASASLGLGQWLTYTVVVTNAGPYAATGVALSDLLPAGVDFLSAESSQGTTVNSPSGVNAALGTIAIGASATVSIVVRPTVVGACTNATLVSSGTIDPNVNNNVSSWSTVVAALPTADLLVDVRASRPSVPVGSDLTYTLMVVNNGPDTATSVLLTVPLLAGMEFVSASGGVTPASGTLTFGLGSLAVGATASRTAVFRGSVPGDVLGVASASSNEGGTNSASVAITVVQPSPPPVDLTLLSSVGDTYVPIGGNLVYTLMVTNNSPTVATKVVIANKLPGSATFVSATANRGTVTQANGVVTVDLGSVTNDSPVSITIQATPSQPDVLMNRASVSSAEADGNPADNISYELALSVVLITAVEKLGDDLRLSFESSAGKHYIVQKQPDLQSGDWVDVPGTGATGTGHMLHAIVVNPFGPPNEFYRVVLQP